MLKRNLKQALNHELVLKKEVHRIIKFNQKAWLKPNIDINTDLSKKAKTGFEKNFLKLINNAVFGKTMKNVRKIRNIKLLAAEKRRNYLVSEPKVLSILELNKIIMYEFWYDYVKPRYGEKRKLCYIGTNLLSYCIYKNR